MSYTENKLVHLCALSKAAFFFQCTLVFCIYVCVRISDPLEVELQIAMSCHVGAGN